LIKRGIAETAQYFVSEFWPKRVQRFVVTVILPHRKKLILKRVERIWEVRPTLIFGHANLTNLDPTGTMFLSITAHHDERIQGTESEPVIPVVDQ
jgi:hypothetical protein